MSRYPLPLSLLPKHLGGTKPHPRSIMTDEEIAASQARSQAARAAAYGLLGQRADARRQRRYQRFDQQAAWNREDELQQRDFEQKQALAAQDWAGRFGLQAGDIQSRYGLQSLEGQQALERGRQGYLYDLDKIGMQGDINARAAQLLYGHQADMQDRGALIEQDMMLLQGQIDEMSAVLSHGRKLEEKEIDYDLGEQSADSQLERMQKLAVTNNQLAREIKELEARQKAAAEEKKRFEDRRDATTDYTRSIVAGRMAAATTAQKEEQLLFHGQHLDRQDQLAPGFRSGRYYYDDGQLQEIERLQRLRDEQMAKIEYYDPQRAYIAMQFDRKIWAIEDSPREKPWAARRQTVLDELNGNTVYEDPKKGKFYEEDGEGRIPVQVVIDESGRPKVDRRNAPDPPPAPQEQLNPFGRNRKEQAEAEGKFYDARDALALKLMAVKRYDYDQEEEVQLYPTLEEAKRAADDIMASRAAAMGIPVNQQQLGPVQPEWEDVPRDYSSIQQGLPGQETGWGRVQREKKPGIRWRDAAKKVDELRSQLDQLNSSGGKVDNWMPYGSPMVPNLPSEKLGKDAERSRIERELSEAIDAEEQSQDNEWAEFFIQNVVSNMSPAELARPENAAKLRKAKQMLGLR